VTAGFVSRLSLAVAVVLSFADGRTVFPFALSDAARTFVAMAEVGDFDVGDGDADVFAPLAADHFAVRDVLPQVLADFPAHNLLEALLVMIDGPRHDVTSYFLVPTLCVGTHVSTLCVASDRNAEKPNI
jgi:hypothetical protein